MRAAWSIQAAYQHVREQETASFSAAVLLDKACDGVCALQANPKKSQAQGALTRQEDRSKGSVSRSVYLTYLRAWGPGLLLPCIFLSIAICERGLQVCCHTPA